jgi:hypothetical protein
MALFEYQKQTQRFLREAKQDFINPEDLTSYINRARREIAMRAQCVRVLTPISGQIVTIAVTAGGSGYTAPSVVISAPDFPSGVLPYPNGAQATASANVIGGVIVSINVVFGGSGYFEPEITITDPIGTGATAVPTVEFPNLLNTGQEVYNFSSINLSQNLGCQSVYYVRSISIIYSNYRYSLPVYAFSVYQSMIRQYPFQYEYVPTFASQFGQGTNGSFYVYPLPSQSYQFELDCLCIPSDLTDDNSVEAIPQPWTDAVPYMAAHLGFLELQNYNAAQFFLGLYEKFALQYSQYARVGRTVNPYGRY